MRFLEEESLKTLQYADAEPLCQSFSTLRRSVDFGSRDSCSRLRGLGSRADEQGAVLENAGHMDVTTRLLARLSTCIGMP